MKAESLMDALGYLALQKRLSWSEVDRLLQLEDSDLQEALESHLLELQANGQKYVSKHALALYEALK